MGLVRRTRRKRKSEWKVGSISLMVYFCLLWSTVYHYTSIPDLPFVPLSISLFNLLLLSALFLCRSHPDQNTTSSHVKSRSTYPLFVHFFLFIFNTSSCMYMGMGMKLAIRDKLFFCCFLCWDVTALRSKKGKRRKGKEYWRRPYVSGARSSLNWIHKYIQENELWNMANGE